MTADLLPLLELRSWYGLTGRFGVDGDLTHLVRLGRVRFDHPALVNHFLRAGLPLEDRLRLSFLHEFGHLQTLPVAMAHAFLLLCAGRGGRRPLDRIVWLAGLALLHQATWELASEAFAVASDRRGYRETYRRQPNSSVPIFWAVMAVLSGGLTWLLLRRR